MAETRVGTQFGPYRIDALLGRGGMGEVYRAYDTGRDREVALKVLLDRFGDDENFQERFRRECQAVAKLGEPHIIPIHDFGEIDGALYLDMRLVDGENLRQVLRKRGPLSPELSVSIVEQVAAALDAAHKVDLVHRDVKPENVLLTDTNFAYLVDFGVAHQGDDEHLTKTGTAIGSLAYMAPEQFDNVPVTPASDEYSLAAVLFELLTGRQPYAGDTVSAVVKATVLNEAPAASSFNSAVPPALDAVIARGLAKEPANRFGSAGELGAAAHAALSGQFPASPNAATQVVAPPTVGGTTPYGATMVGQISPSGPQRYPSAPVTQYSGPQAVGPQYAPQYSGPVVYAQPPGGGDGRAAQIVLAGIIGLLVAALIGLAVYWFGFRSADDLDAAPTSTTTLTSTLASTAPTVAAPPPDSSPCDSTVGVGSGVTSCPFAQSVRTAYLAAGPKGEARTVTAFSPVTGMSYAMSCNPESGIIVCRGGNNAVVHIY
ncbi:MAG: serine/threonine-protein kinase [Gordonia sp. (in: high G+C Gram-positive bacteria)]